MLAIPSRTLVSTFITLAVAVVFAIPSETLAKKKSKKKAADKDETAQVDAKPTESPEQIVAREHYIKGKKLYEDKQFEDAMKEFEAAYAAKSHPTVLKSIAECHVSLGSIGQAVATLEKYMAAPDAPDKVSVEARIREIKAIPVPLNISSTPAGAKISIAGSDIAEATPTTVELSAGEYVITLSADGYTPVSRSIAVTLDGPNELSIDFAVESQAAAPASDDDVAPLPVDQPAPLEEESRAKIPNAFWVSAAIAGVGLVSGTVFGTLALSEEKDYNENPTPAKKESGERDAIIADVSFGVAGVAAIVGIVVLVTDRKKNRDKSRSANLQVLPVAGGETIGLSASVAF